MRTRRQRNLNGDDQENQESPRNENLYHRRVHLRNPTNPAINPTSPRNQLNPPNQANQVLSRDQNDIQTKLQEIYENIKSSPSFSAKITKFLQQNPIHSVHKRIVKHKFPRRRIITRYPFQIFQGDLIEYSQSAFSYANKGNRFILVLIDCFSKMVYARPVKRKSAECMAMAFESIFNEFDYFPNSLITDQGLEFFNSRVKKVFNTYGINHYYLKTKTKWKTAMAERVIRTLKNRLQKYFYKNKTKNWIDVLQQVVDNYNNTPHRTIGIAPSKVTFQNSEAIYKKMFGDINLRVIPRLAVGDRVRLLREKTLFEKGYTPNWTEEIFVISDVRQKAGVVWYIVQKLDGEKVPGIKYYYQLNLVTKNVDNDKRNNRGTIRGIRDN